MSEPLRRERKKAALRQRILTEARHLIVRKGYWATKVEEIAAAADVAPATLFNYFPSKPALVAALASDTLERIADLVTGDTGAAGPALPRLRAFFTRAAAHIEHAETELRGVLLMAVRATALSDAGRDRLVRLRQAFSGLLYAGQQADEVRKDVDATFLSELVTGVFLAALTSWLNDPRYPLGIRMAQVADFVTDALSPTTAHHRSQTTHNDTTRGDNHARCNDDHRRPRRER